ncbi:MAG: hypothetical protein RLY49_149 [Candidatus Parcubacteria bacterium]|jgi:peptidoglycan hydrolase-like protein with peptidoglycan-binding domain
MNFKNKFFITLFLFLILGTKNTFAFSGLGAGTEIDPYQITTCTQLQEIAGADINEINYYTLVQDVDCSDTVNWNGGLGFEPIGTLGTPFEPIVILTGGTGHKITNLYINRPEQDYVGIFGYSVAEVTIQGIGLINPIIVGHDYVGTFGGSLTSSAPSLFRIYTNGGSVTGNSYVGGLVGVGETLGIEESFSSTIVSGVSNVGGVAGDLVGEINFIADVYYDSERSEQSDIGKGTPQTHLEMLTLSTYGGFDFDTIWGMEDGVTYPYLGTAEVAATITVPVLQDGTEQHPFLISNCTELQDMENDLDAYYELTQDIDCSDTVNWNSGTGFMSVGAQLYTPFTGVLDGADHTISNLFIDRTADEDGTAGLFGASEGGVIRDLTLADIDISGVGSVGGLISAASQDYASTTRKTILSNVHVSGILYSETNLLGGLIAHAIGGTRILNSSANIIITSGTSTAQVGGLVGWDEDGYIIESYSIGSVTGAYDVGGLTGINTNTQILNSYSTANVTATLGAAGGLVGQANTANIENSYSAGEVEGNVEGGLIGTNSGSTIISSYYDMQTSGQSDSGKGTGTTTSAMKLSTTFSNWDFDSVWGIEETVTYPTLNNVGITGEIPIEDRTSRSSKSGYTKQTGGKLPTADTIVNPITIKTQNGGGGLTVEQAKEALLAIVQSFNRNLSIGLEGDDVKKLQYFLISENTGPAALEVAKVGATGYFGNLTLQAVIEFQKANNIVPALGFVGPLTRAEISKILNLEFVEVYIKLGSTGAEVKNIQELLISKNAGPAAFELAKVGATGYFGNLTQQATIEFQKANQITGEDGYVGPKTKGVIK